jgi:hypothetical protein
MKPTFSFFGLTAVCLSLLLVSGCSSNIFKSLETAKQKTAAEAIRTGDFNSALSTSQAIIDSGATGPVLQSALVDKGVAILGQQNSLPYAVLPAVKTVADNPTSANTVIKVINDTVTIPLDKAQAAADALNYAQNLSSSSNISIQTVNVVFSPSLNASAQLNRAVANFTVVVKMTTLYLDISSNPLTITLNSLALASDIKSKDVVAYLSTPPKTMAYYLTNAIDAAEKANVLTTSQLNIVKKTQPFGPNLANLNTIRLNGDTGTFQVRDKDGQVISSFSSITFSSGDSESVRDSKYRSAVEQILRSIN